MGRVVDAVKNARELLFTSFFGRELVGRHSRVDGVCTALHLDCGGTATAFRLEAGRAREVAGDKE